MQEDRPQTPTPVPPPFRGSHESHGFRNEPQPPSGYFGSINSNLGQHFTPTMTTPIPNYRLGGQCDVTRMSSIARAANDALAWRCHMIAALVLCCLMSPLIARAQTKDPEKEAPKRTEKAGEMRSPLIVPETSDTEDDVLVLSPFEVTASADDGSYTVTDTLAGTRVKTEINDIASSLSVFTRKFMQDIGATDSQTLLQYTTNAEVGGTRGNYAGVGSTYTDGFTESAFVNPDRNTRIRGLDSADNTRDYFQSNIPWDSYNTGRIDLQRGPNSILFGIGSPAGILNANINTAGFKSSYKAEYRFGSFGSARATLDANRVLIKDTLSLRLSLLDSQTNYRQEGAFNDDKRIFLAARWEPKLIKWASAHTAIRVNFEHGDISSNNPRLLPPKDAITAFFDPNKINRTTWDPAYLSAAGIPGTSTNTLLAGQNKNYWVYQGLPNMLAGRNPMFIYNADSSNPITVRQNLPDTWGGVNASGAAVGGLSGYPYMPMISIASYGQYAFYNNRANPTDPTSLGGQSNFWKTPSLTDPSIFDFYNYLIDGPTKKEWQDWNAYNFALDQTFIDGRLGVQLAYDYQDYNNGQTRVVADPTINVDINTNVAPGLPWAYNQPAVINFNGTGTAGTNPNAGRPYVGGNSQYGNSSNANTRENFRATLTGELRASDFMPKSWLSRLLGRHVFTGLFNQEIYDNESRSWARYAVTPDYMKTVGNGNTVNALTAGYSTLDMLTYVGGPLFSNSSASGLHLQPLSAAQSPSGATAMTWFNSQWKGAVSPSAPWHNPVDLLNTAAVNAYQNSNPANYVGWTTSNFTVLNADSGDIESLYWQGTKTQTKTKSKALTWQGYFWDGVVIPMVGWREDTQELRSGNAPINSLGVASMNYSLSPLDPARGKTSGNSNTWGVVIHTPKKISEKMPWGTSLSLTFNHGENMRAQNRYGFDANPLPNPSGETTDYGFIVNTLNDRLRLKVSWYKTKVANATLTNALGGNVNWLWQTERSSVGGAMAALAGMAGDTRAPSWYWNWALVEANYPAQVPGQPWVGDPTSTAFLNNPTTIKEKATIASLLSQLRPQSWYDAYGIPVNVVAAKAGDYANAIAGWNPSSPTTVKSTSVINGVAPVGTYDNESRGVEIELTGQITKDWNVSLNVSKQRAQQTALGASFIQFVEESHNKWQSAAGDWRLYSANDRTVQEYFNSNIWSAYQFQLKTNGKMVSEMSPWRANVVTNYKFSRGTLKGLSVGLGYRWQDGIILGYAMLPDGSNLDINKPFWGKSEEAVDVWVGYERKLAKKLRWRIQLNGYSVSKDVHLVPINVQPDGSPANFRIAEGQTWSVTNTLSF